ncbi:hypothetical protein SFB61_14975 [Legionella pneumophila]|nr:hypothetical protein [Legionella pneumophila]MDW8908280.1 hypothetical protein [Legionella pneumophila]CZP18154.1 Uncharacterised protein [Legionella pneumophila]
MNTPSIISILETEINIAVDTQITIFNTTSVQRERCSTNLNVAAF